MSRPPRSGLPLTHRDRLKQDALRAAPLRDQFPQLAELHVEFAFQDGSTFTPASQSYSYFPSARGFFRYACPCHSCSGEFDLTAQIAELAGKSGRSERSRRMEFTCTGQRAEQWNAQAACPVSVRARVSAVPHPKESAS